MEQMFTLAINDLQDLKQGIKQRLSYMRFFMAQETPRSELSSEETKKTGESLRIAFSEIHQVLADYENELLKLLVEDTSEDLTVESYKSDQNMLH